MTIDRLARLESTIARLEAELQTTRTRLAAVETAQPLPTRRSVMARPGALVAFTVLAFVAALGLGTAVAAPAPQTLTVKAVHVLGSNGDAWLRGDGLIFSRGSSTVAGLGAQSDVGGVLGIYNATGKSVAVIQAGSSGAGRLIVDGKSVRAVLGEPIGATPSQGSNPFALRIYKGGIAQSGIGIGEHGGIVQVNDTTGARVASMGSTGKAGEVGVYGIDGTQRASVGANSSNGNGGIDVRGADGKLRITLQGLPEGGYFALTNASGNAMVEGGVLASGIGVVRAYPEGGKNWYIKGKTP